MPEIKMRLTQPRQYAAALETASRLAGGPNATTLHLDALRGMILDQIPKPHVPEPEAFGSLIRARAPQEDDQVAADLWQMSPVHGKHYWMSQSGVLEVWSELTDVEVLRVGLGEPELANAEAGGYAKGHLDGARGMNENIHHLLQRLLADAITGERKNAFEKAIQAVEELAP